jgi:hypothetical protein
MNLYGWFIIALLTSIIVKHNHMFHEQFGYWILVVFVFSMFEWQLYQLHSI